MLLEGFIHVGWLVVWIRLGHNQRGIKAASYGAQRAIPTIWHVLLAWDRCRVRSNNNSVSHACARSTRYTDSSGTHARCLIVARTPRKAKPQATAGRPEPSSGWGWGQAWFAPGAARAPMGVGRSRSSPSCHPWRRVEERRWRRVGFRAYQKGRRNY
jgi:hypothetical protein